MAIRSATAAVAAALALLVAACNTVGPGVVRALQPFDERASAESGYGRAFGRIVYEGREPSNLLTTDHVVLYIRPAEGGDVESMDLATDGQFNWPLKPGEYVVAGYQAIHADTYPAPYVLAVSLVRFQTGRVWATFSIPAAGRAVYIGDLRVVASTSGRELTVIDRYDEALSTHDFALKQGKFEPSKGLMQLEKSVATHNRVSGICSEPAWGISCSDDFRGVEPVLPQGTAVGYPLVRDRSPVLEWKPSRRPNVTYDVVVYESYPEGPGNPRLQAARVAYAEGLRDPRFVVPTPLQPSMTYEWSVRLREGDTVSTWSSANRSLPLKPRFMTFGFRTPEK